MENLGGVILALLAATLSHLVAAQHWLFTLALQCTQALVDFYLMAQYHSHTTKTLDYLQQYFHTFHKTNHFFQEFCASKKIVQKLQTLSII